MHQDQHRLPSDRCVKGFCITQRFCPNKSNIQYERNKSSSKFPNFPHSDFSSVMRFSFTTSVTVCMFRPVCVTEVNVLKFIGDDLLSTVDALKWCTDWKILGQYWWLYLEFLLGQFLFLLFLILPFCQVNLEEWAQFKSYSCIKCSLI